jgi:hypothetical protein
MNMGYMIFGMIMQPISKNCTFMLTPDIIILWMRLPITIESKPDKGGLPMNYDTDMQQYKDFQPTCFDSKGYMLDDQQDWYVIPVSRTRDTGPFEESNFEAALEILGGERTNIVEVHRFGHWGPGWFEIIIVNPRAGKTMRKALSIEASLADYPVLDDEDFSRREWEEMEETWANISISERMEICAKTDNSIFSARHVYIPDGVYYEHLCGC